MGQCLKNLKSHSEPPPEQTKKTQLLSKNSPLTIHNSTRNDRQFTYFLGVFQLVTLGSQLQLPEFIDELHPNFSYQKFNDTYHKYQKQIINLGKFIELSKNKVSPLNKRLESDRRKIPVLRNHNKIPEGTTPGCFVKIQLQDVKWPAAKEVGVVLLHPQNWEGKFEKWTKTETIKTGPVYFEFPVPEYKGAVVKILGKDTKAEIAINLQEAFKNHQQVVCKIMKWKGAAESQGIAVRYQLLGQNPEQQQSKIQEMTELHKKLIQDYGVDGQIQQSMTDKDINERLSRHRSSLSQKYNLGLNHMF